MKETWLLTNLFGIILAANLKEIIDSQPQQVHLSFGGIIGLYLSN